MFGRKTLSIPSPVTSAWLGSIPESEVFGFVRRVFRGELPAGAFPGREQPEYGLEELRNDLPPIRLAAIGQAMLGLVRDVLEPAAPWTEGDRRRVLVSAGELLSLGVNAAYARDAMTLLRNALVRRIGSGPMLLEMARTLVTLQFDADSDAWWRGVHRDLLSMGQEPTTLVFQALGRHDGRKALEWLADVTDSPSRYAAANRALRAGLPYVLNQGDKSSRGDRARLLALGVAEFCERCPEVAAECAGVCRALGLDVSPANMLDWHQVLWDYVETDRVDRVDVRQWLEDKARRSARPAYDRSTLASAVRSFLRSVVMTREASVPTGANAERIEVPSLVPQVSTPARASRVLQLAEAFDTDESLRACAAALWDSRENEHTLARVLELAGSIPHDQRVTALVQRACEWLRHKGIGGSLPGKRLYESLDRVENRAERYQEAYDPGGVGVGLSALARAVRKGLRAAGPALLRQRGAA